MLIDYADRIFEEAYYISQTGSTVRAASKVFHLSKSTIHKDVTERLFLLDRELYFKVKKVLDKNFSERHIRGGLATKIKYQRIKNLTV